MSLFIPPNVKIIVESDSGEIRHSQPLSRYLQRPSVNIQAATYGHSLLDTLVEESFIDERLELRQILTGNDHADATRLIGSIAEALVVDFCNRHQDVNRTLGTYARFGRRESKALDDYVAVATGSMRTKRIFAQHYNPSDTQRDIIWVERDNTEHQLFCIRSGTSLAGKPAGLQVKASHDGLKYVLPTLQDYHYPVLYFDLKDDWGAVKSAAMDRNPGCVFIHPDEIHAEIKHILKGYFQIVVALIRGEITLLEVIDEAKYRGDRSLASGMDGGELTDDSQIILPSNIE